MINLAQYSDKACISYLEMPEMGIDLLSRDGRCCQSVEPVGMSSLRRSLAWARTFSTMLNFKQFCAVAGTFPCHPIAPRNLFQPPDQVWLHVPASLLISVGKPERLQHTQPAGACGLLPPIRMIRRHPALPVPRSNQITIDSGRAFLQDVEATIPRGAYFETDWPKVERHKLGRPRLKSVSKIFARDDQITASIIQAPDHDMAVRAAGVIVVRRDPIQIGL
jgi:hypothetical protein